MRNRFTDIFLRKNIFFRTEEASETAVEADSNETSNQKNDVSGGAHKMTFAADSSWQRRKSRADDRAWFLREPVARDGSSQTRREPNYDDEDRRNDR